MLAIYVVVLDRYHFRNDLLYFSTVLRFIYYVTEEYLHL